MMNFNIVMKLFARLKRNVLLMHRLLLRDTTEIAR